MLIEFFNLENTKVIFWFLESCKGIEQKHKWHPEGDVFVHSLQVGSLAFRETHDIDLIFAAYLHDIGKMICSNGHSEIGCELLSSYVSVKTLFLIEHHMRIRTYLDGEMKKLSKCQFLVTHPWFPELIQLNRWDKMGRNPNKKVSYDKIKIIEKLNNCIDKHFCLPEHLNDYEGCYGLEENEGKERI